MQQVARALLEDAAAVRAAVASASNPRRIDLTASGGAAAADPATLLALARAKEERLLALVAGALGAAGGAKEAAFEANLDRVVELGWAYTERLCLQNMLAEAARAGRADAAIGAALRALSTLYGASRAERGVAGLLAVGAIGGQDAEALRGAVNALCRKLGSGGSAAPALVLCDGFGIPEHLLAAPIAFNWRAFGAE
jgi:acyl-CoA oxidase